MSCPYLFDVSMATNLSPAQQERLAQLYALYGCEKPAVVLPGQPEQVAVHALTITGFVEQEEGIPQPGTGSAQSQVDITKQSAQVTKEETASKETTSQQASTGEKVKNAAVKAEEWTLEHLALVIVLVLAIAGGVTAAMHFGVFKQKKGA